MQTVYKEDDGNKRIFITQQYETGLYIAIYREGSARPDQMSAKIKEVPFHRRLRKRRPDFIKEESSVLPEKVSKRRLANVGNV